MNDEQLIELVRNYEVLYDTSDPKYMDINLKVEIWKEIGKQMSSDGALCKSRWNNIRDNYRKSLKKAVIRTGQAAKKVKFYKYSEQLGFLRKYIDDRPTKGNIEIQIREENNMQSDSQQENESEEPTIRNFENQPILSEQQPVSSEQPVISEQQAVSSVGNIIQLKKYTRFKRKPATKKNIPQKTVAGALMEYLIKKEEEATNEKSTDPVDAFLAAIAPTLKSLNPYYLHFAKSEIFSTVQKYEMKMLMERYSHEEKSNISSDNSNNFYSMIPIVDPIHSPASHSSTSTQSASYQDQHRQHSSLSMDN